MDRDDKTPKPFRGGRLKEPVEDSASGLDVRQLLGLGREKPEHEPEPATTRETFASEPPAFRPPKPTPREPQTNNRPGTEPGSGFSSRQARSAPMEPKFPPRPHINQPPRPVLPSKRPQRPSFSGVDNPNVQANPSPELSIDPSTRTRLGSSFSKIASGDQRPIPPVSDPKELPDIRPPIDPLAGRTPSTEQPPLSAAPIEPHPPAPDPSIAANARLEELATLSEKTLKDYEAFDDLDGTGPQKSKRTPVVVLASLLGIGIIAGGVVFAYRQGVRESTQTELPVIVAASKAIKEEPSNPGGVKIPHQNKLIYDRILGEETDIAEKIVPREEEAVNFSQQPAHTTVSKTPASGNTTGQASPSAKASPFANAPSASAIIKQSTDEVAKKLASIEPPNPVPPPDSLISGNANVPELSAPGTRVPAVNTPQGVPNPVSETLDLPTRVQGQNPLQSGGEIVRLETEVVSGNPPSPSTPSVPPAPEATTQPTAQGLGTIKLVKEPGDVDTEPVASVKLPPALPRRKPRPPASRSTRITSLNLPEISTASPTVPTPTGAYVIQIAAFRSQVEALSRFAKLKRRYSSLLRPYTSFVQRADLGDSGVYYRLRLGPIDGKEKAAQLCRSLLAAGETDCLVRTR